MNAKEIYTSFGKLTDSQHIASEFAIAGLIKWLTKCKPRTIFEVGTGLGTLTYTTVTTLETNVRLISLDLKPEFTKKAFMILGALSKNVEFVQSIKQIKEAPSCYDFVIGDGGSIKDSALWTHVTNLSRRGVFFIEGNRLPTRRIIEDRLKAGRRFAVTSFRPFDQSTSYWIFQCEPTLAERVWFSLNNTYNRVVQALVIRAGLQKPHPRHRKAIIAGSLGSTNSGYRGS